MARRRHNTQTESDRRRLMLDLELRIREDDQSGDYRHQLFRPRSLAWVVHPLADEAELLRELGIAPEDCAAVDCYWCFGNSVHFVQVFAGPALLNLAPGTYYSFDRQVRQDRFRVQLASGPVSSDDLHRVLEQLEALIDAESLSPLTLRGLARPVPIWSVRGLR